MFVFRLLNKHKHLTSFLTCDRNITIFQWRLLGIYYLFFYEAADSTVAILSARLCMFTDICSFPSQCFQTDGAMVTSQGGTVVTESCTFCFCEFMHACVNVREPSQSHINNTCYSVHLTVSGLIESAPEDVEINKKSKDVYSTMQKSQAMVRLLAVDQIYYLPISI